MLLQHRSGIGPYGAAFMDSLVRDPAGPHDPLEGVESVLDTPALFPAGQGFSYSDVNFVLLAYIAEAVSGAPAYRKIVRRFLGPLQLGLVRPADRRRIQGLVQGYAGTKNPFGGERMLVDGELVLDPSFAWGGGGFVSNPRDLARWMADFCEGRAFDAGLLPSVFDGPPAAQLGPNTRYGLGVHIDAPRFGRALGHGGFFPGYTTCVRWYETPRIALAIQLNTSDEQKLSVPLEDVLERGLRALLDLPEAPASGAAKPPR
ncbi:MAG: class A beta-lactamase-related serine hydrolase [Planctomycetes bacterium]|nr:class A beta-lactamase-related serine hydrolase [Planctomycetota bacterium]